MSDEPQFEVLHNLSYDRSKGRYRCRFTIFRGRKVVGKRLAIHLHTSDRTAAIVARDSILCALQQLGLTIIRRRQRRNSNDQQEG